MNRLLYWLYAFFPFLKPPFDPRPDIVEDEFEKLTLDQRYRCIRDYGEHITERQYGNFIVYLFSYNKFFVEVWKRVGLGDVPFIEIIDEEAAFNRYNKKL